MWVVFFPPLSTAVLHQWRGKKNTERFRHRTNMAGIFCWVFTSGDSREAAGRGTLPWELVTINERATCRQIIQRDVRLRWNWLCELRGICVWKNTNFHSVICLLAEGQEWWQDPGSFALAILKKYANTCLWYSDGGEKKALKHNEDRNLSCRWDLLHSTTIAISWCDKDGFGGWQWRNYNRQDYILWSRCCSGRCSMILKKSRSSSCRHLSGLRKPDSVCLPGNWCYRCEQQILNLPRLNVATHKQVRAKLKSRVQSPKEFVS